MNYQLHYDLLIERALKRELPENTYAERHHIKPKCTHPELIKEPSNLVALLPREHFIAHLLLFKINPGVYGLWKAVRDMSGRKSHNSKQYSWLKTTRYAMVEPEETRMKKSESAKNRAPLSESSKQKMREMAIQRYIVNPELREVAREKSSGRKLSDDAKQKLSEVAKKRKPMTEETRQKISNASSLFRHSEESRSKISEKALSRYPHYKLIDPNGVEYVVVGINEFAKNLGVCPSSIRKMVGGIKPTWGKLKGWTGEII